MRYQQLWQRLTPLYDPAEAKAIVLRLCGERFGMSHADLLCGQLDQLDTQQTADLNSCIRRLAEAEPVQYVLGSETFCGRTFSVAPGVLIPRPETEQLCRWAIDDLRRHADGDCRPDVLDIGTGSGCIAITLALQLPTANVCAWDISPEAVAIARGNAQRLGAKVIFNQQDALNPPADNRRWDAIVSNPPYICQSEAADMHPNVLNHEPHTALFVPDTDPLLFYRSIARYATVALRRGASLYFEINPLYADDTERMLRSLGFGEVETADDEFGKRRFTKATLA